MKIHIALALLCICFSCKNNTEVPIANSNETEKIPLSQVEPMSLTLEGRDSPNGLLKDLNETKVEIKSFRGKLLVIDFWATWCAPCLEEAPMFKALAKKYEGTNAEFISISIDQEYADWKNYVSENNWEGKNYWYGMKEDEPFFSFLYSKTMVETKEMTLIGIPKYVILSPTGKILSNSDLRPGKPGFEEEIQKHLNETFNN